MNNGRNNIKALVGVFVSLSVIYYLFTHLVDLGSAVSVLGSVNLLVYFVSDIPYFVQSLVMGYKIQWILGKAGEKVKYWNAYFSNEFGMLLSNFSFGRSGYLGTVLGLASNTETSTGVVTGAIIVDAMAKGSFVVISLVLYPILFPFNSEVFSIMNLITVFGVSMFMIGYIVLNFGEKLPLPSKLNNIVSSFNVVRKYWVKVYLFSVVGWIMRVFEWYFLAKACGIDLTLFQIFALHPLITILRLIPVSISGLGFVEMALIKLVPSAPAQNLIIFGLLDMINNIFVDWVGLKVLVNKNGRNA